MALVLMVRFGNTGGFLPSFSGKRACAAATNCLPRSIPRMETALAKMFPYRLRKASSLGKTCLTSVRKSLSPATVDIIRSGIRSSANLLYLTDDNSLSLKTVIMSFVPSVVIDPCR